MAAKLLLYKVRLYIGCVIMIRYTDEFSSRYRRNPVIEISLYNGQTIGCPGFSKIDHYISGLVRYSIQIPMYRCGHHSKTGTELELVVGFQIVWF
jgi:hypothetical protein